MLALFLLPALVLTVPVFADVIWEPDNQFYREHADACEYHNRSYLANSPQGYVDLCKAPGSTVTVRVDNGQTLHANFLYEDWAYVTTQDAEGWAELDQLSLIYDGISFAQEYSDQILPSDASVTAPLLTDYIQSGGTTLVCWPYPNAAVYSYCNSNGADMLEALLEYGFSSVFTDEEGHLWGYCGYLYGFRDFWVLLDDPGAGDGVTPAPEDSPEDAVGPRIVDVREIPEVTLYSAAEEKPLPDTVKLSGTLVAAVVVLSAAALWGIYRKKKAV